MVVLIVNSATLPSSTPDVFAAMAYVAAGVREVSRTCNDAVLPWTVTVRVSTPSVVRSAAKGTEIVACPLAAITTEPVSDPPTTSEALTPDRV